MEVSVRQRNATDITVFALATCSETVVARSRYDDRAAAALSRCDSSSASSLVLLVNDEKTNLMTLAPLCKSAVASAMLLSDNVAPSSLSAIKSLTTPVRFCAKTMASSIVAGGLTHVSTVVGSEVAPTTSVTATPTGRPYLQLAFFACPMVSSVLVRFVLPELSPRLTPVPFAFRYRNWTGHAGGRGERGSGLRRGGSNADIKFAI